ncbi:MAG: hypothetical protein IJS68_02065 [Clostridia bacterium]|nr:hypothetical protein [Clostridia bacterium]
MKAIYVLEHLDFDEEQMSKLNSLGRVHYFDYANDEQIKEAIEKADAILFDWIDPDKLLPNLRQGQFICLPYTGYNWIKTLKLAVDNGVSVSYIPNYSTNAVAEHHLSLILDCAKHISYFNEKYKSGVEVPFNRIYELKGKKIGIIGLGHIGTRLAELLSVFDVEIMTYNRTPKHYKNVKDVDLETLLKECDIVCNTCKLTQETNNLLGKLQFEMMKHNAILTSTTGGIINLDDLTNYIDKFFAIGLEDVEHQIVPKQLIDSEKVICTYHRAYDTYEAEHNRINLFIENIKAFFEGKQINIVSVQ